MWEKEAGVELLRTWEKNVGRWVRFRIWEEVGS